MQRARSAVVAISFAATLAALVLIQRRGFPLARFRVDGDSMLPSYDAGARVLVNRWAYLRAAPAANDVVVLEDPEQPGRTLLKRVAFDFNNVDGVYVLGDNGTASRDSRHFGEIPRSAIIGRVILRY